MLLSEVRIILSHVSDAANAGAVCRAMKNMGLTQLRLAAPQPLVLERIFTLAVNAWDVWENARIYNTLAEAAADCSIVVGATRRRGENRKSVSMTPRDLASWLAGKPGCTAAIVFGNERTGLEEAELDLCNFASHIPVSQNCPSLNLSHAVQVYAYELFLAMNEQLPVKGEWTPMNQAEIEAQVSRLADNLTDLGFYRNPNRERQSRFLRDIIARAGLAEREGRYFTEIITKAWRLSGN